jgi:hypothetical protein
VKVLFFNGIEKLKDIWETGSFEMEIRHQKSSVLSAGNVSAILSSENKSPPPVFRFHGNSNIHSYNKSLVRNRFALHTAGRYSVEMFPSSYHEIDSR